MSVFYNDFDPNAAEWLHRLIDADKLPFGVVSSESICELQGQDIDEYTQCHFFCGIGGWPLALKMAEVPEYFNVWTGSCPCQPFSTAAINAKGFEDERDLWRSFYKLISHGKPDFVFGEQVATAAKNGWLDRLCNDLQDAGYLVLASVLSAQIVGAPHQRKRLYWGGSEWMLWRTPTCSDKHGSLRWAIPRGALENFGHAVKNGYLAAQHFGRTENGLRAQKGKALYLNTEHSRWLMGFPIVWSSVLDTGMQSSHKLERCS